MRQADLSGGNNTILHAVIALVVFTFTGFSAEAGPTWSHFAPSGAGPTLNSNPPVYDPGSNRLIVFGGLFANGSCCVRDTWVLTNANGTGGMPQWQQLAPGGTLPPPRAGDSAVYDHRRTK